MVFDMVPAGMYSRLAIGSIILTHAIAYNETGAITVLFAAFVAMVCATLSAWCKSSLNQLQLPYIRAMHKFDFAILFLALWMDILTLICACGALTRTLSVCFDAMTDGMARIYILGRNAPDNEPWPDIIGFLIVFIVSTMFMLGLENSRVFSIILLICLCGIVVFFILITSIRGNLSAWQSKEWFPKGLNGLVSSAAMLVFSYPSEMPPTTSCKHLKGMILCMFVCLSIVFCSGCLSTIIDFTSPNDFIAVPVLSLLATLDFRNFEPAVACLYVLICSCAFIEVFSEMFNLIVKLTSSEWKILSRQIGYEHGDSGSPVLAIFIGGSLCAMIAFACPLEITITFIAGSHLFACLLRIFYVFYTPFRPKYMINTKNDTSLGYSQLKPSKAPIKQSSTNPTLQQTTSIHESISKAGRILRCLSKPSIVPMPRSKSHNSKKPKRNEEVEREWLLLGEPMSPRNTIILDEEQDTSTLTITAKSASASVLDRDVEGQSKCVDESDSDSSESSTDIDAVFDEYRQKIEVTASGPSEKILQIPSIESWRLSIILMTTFFVSIGFCAIGFLANSLLVFAGSFIAVIIITGVMTFLPRYAHSDASPNVAYCCITIFIESILLASTFSVSLPAIIAWVIGGLLIFTRCDTWFSICIEQPLYINHIVTPTSAPITKISRIRLPNPPKGSLITSHLNAQCR